MSRYFEEGYRIAFGRHRGSLIRFMGLALILLFPQIEAIMLHFGALYGLVLSLFYIAAAVFLTYLTKHLVGVGNAKMYYTASIFVLTESVVIDFALTVMQDKVTVLIGALAALVPLSTLFSLLKDPRGVRPTWSYVTDLAIFFAAVLAVQLPSYTILGLMLNRPVVPRLSSVLYLDLVMFSISIVIQLAMLMLHGIKGTLSYLKMFGAYLYAMLTGDGSFMEYHLAKMAKEYDVKVHVVRINDGDSKYALIVPYVHAGPLAHVGGGDLIPMFVKRGREARLNVIYLHGVGGHEVDPASAEDAVKIVDSAIGEAARLMNGYKARIRARPISTVTVGGVKLTTLPIADGKNLVLVTRLNKSMDDIPLNIYEEVKSIVGQGIEDLIIVDSQNNYSPDNSWTSRDVEEFASAIAKVLEMPVIEDELKMGIIHIGKYRVPGALFEIGDNGVYIILEEFGGVKAALAVVDGNNIRRDLAEMLREALRRFSDVAEVVTTDNHQFTGFFGSSGYSVVGEMTNRREFVRIIERSISRIHLRPVEVSHSEVNVRVRVIGVDGFSSMRAAASKSLSMVPILSGLIFLAPLALSILLALLII